MLRVLFGALALSVAIVAMPIAVIALGLAVYPIDFVAKMLGLSGAGDWVSAYLRIAHAAFAPEALPTWLPRIAVLVLGVAALVALVIGWINRGARSQRGPFWWRMAPVPLSSRGTVAHCWRAMWDLLRGAAQLKQPSPVELSRRYLELAGENLGQPGFREILIAVHDLDVHRDLVFALVAESRRRELFRRPTVEAIEERRAEVFDLSGVAREYLPSVLAGAVSLPVATEAAFVTFAPDAYWRGETHRLTDRPGIVARVVDELKSLGAEQILVVSAAPESHRPHALTPPRLDARSRLGEYLQSSEAAAVRDATYLGAGPSVRVFTISPEHNPMGPFDFAGAFDDRSDRAFGLEELMARGYEDAYRQFIEPVVGASGELLKVRS